uniref:Uncharacterized protein n=1 Tax=Panagrolaimus sp. PS1159 TaxID=55785 RepID=A0AC35GVY4_9BILA
MSNEIVSDVKHIKEDGFNIQHDWDKSFSTEKDKFFVNYKKYDEKSTLYNFNCENGKIKVNEDLPEVTTEKHGKKLYIKLDEKNSRTFIAPKLEYQNIHKGGIISVDVSPTENLCVSSDTNGELAVWDTKYGNKVRNLEGHVMDVYKCRFFPSGLVVLSGGMDMTVRIFSVENGWNARTMIGHKGPIHDLGIIEEGENVISCSKDGTLKMWNCGDGKVIQDWSPNSGYLNALALSDGDLHLVGTASENEKAFVYDMRTTESAFEFNTFGNSTAICFDSGMHLFVGTEKAINVYDLRSKKHLMIVETQRGRCNRLIHQGVLGLIGAFNDGTVAAYEDQALFSNGSATIEFTGSDCDPVYDISTNNNSLFSACRDKVIRKYSFE